VDRLVLLEQLVLLVEQDLLVQQVFVVWMVQQGQQDLLHRFQARLGLKV
jgi:hypothetical protein